MFKLPVIKILNNRYKFSDNAVINNTFKDIGQFLILLIFLLTLIAIHKSSAQNCFIEWNDLSLLLNAIHSSK